VEGMARGRRGGTHGVGVTRGWNVSTWRLGVFATWVCGSCEGGCWLA
jgi:hypothetical protein